MPSITNKYLSSILRLPPSYASLRLGLLMMRFLFFAVLFLVLLRPASGQDLDPVEVRQAIAQGVRYLKARQKPDGSWAEYFGEERCGATALAVLALVESGVPRNDPAIRSAMNFLASNSGKDIGRNYSVSLQTMAFCLVDPDRYRGQIRTNVETLEDIQVKGNTQHDGGWYYHKVNGGAISDLSNAQFSILALYEAERVGVSAKRDTWQRAHKYWSNAQNTDGSWGYSPKAGGGCGDARGSMTCAGIASLIITSGILGSGGATVRGDNVICFQKTDDETARKIEKGIEWMAKNFSVSQNPRVGHYLYYYLYALERVGRMTNRRFIGTSDWYRQGADKILKLHNPITGGWSGLGTGDDSSAAFALLFLAKGRRPVLMSKVQYNEDPSWNVHPNDVNNMTVYIESQWKRDLNVDLTWQSVDLRPAKVADLLQAPVLHISGSRSPLMNTEAETAEIALKLREYLDQGGFIFAEAQPNDVAFDKGFRDLMERVFPEPGYELALLESTHPIWRAEVTVDVDQQRPIEGINFGCRTSVVYIPPDKSRPSLSCLWEVAQVVRQDKPYAPVVQKQIDAALSIGQNILAYATNREVQFKYEVAEAIARRTAEAENTRGRIGLALLDPAGGTNPAPMALLKILYYAEENLGLDVVHRTEMINPADDAISEYPILFLHGRNSFQLTEKQREKLRQHLEYGGFLFANSICSSRLFTESFQAEMQKMFPDTKMELIPLTDPLFSDEYGGSIIETVELRVPEQAPGRKTVTATRKTPPELYGLRLENEDRWAVIFSPHDVSCALEKANTLECRGHTSDSAMQIAINVLLYGLEHW